MSTLKIICLRFLFLYLITSVYSSTIFSQHSSRQANILFYQLNTAHGLSDNYIFDLCFDKSGNLWIASGEGLNMFNGKTVTKFFHEEYPQLKNDYLRKLFCDDFNRIWVLTQDGHVTMIDENRKFHGISLYNNNKFIATRWLLYTKEFGVILFTRNGFYSLTEGKSILEQDSIPLSSFRKIEIIGIDTLLTKKYLQTEPYDSSNYIFNTDEGFFKINFKEKKPGRKYAFPELQILTKWGPDDLLVIGRTNPRLQSINLTSGIITDPLEGIKDQFGKPLTARVNYARKINSDQLLLTTQNDGLYIFNLSNRRLYNYKHNAADPTTIVNDWPTVIAADKNGWVFIGATPNGVSYFKSNAVIGQQAIFTDNKGNSYDGPVNKIVTRDNDIFYIGTGNNLLKWKRSTNTTTFIDYATINGEKLMNKDYTISLAFDNYHRLWFNAGSDGVFVLDKNDKPVKNLHFDTTKPNSLIASITNEMNLGPDGYMWLATRGGLCRINPKNFQVDYLEKTALNKLKGIYCYTIFFQDSDNLWIATNGKGLWHYRFSTDSMIVFNTQNRFINDVVVSINKDNDGNIYAGTIRGLQIFLRNGQTKVVTQKDGLMNSRVEILILDKRNRMWIGNDVGIACFNIHDSSLKYFDETYGLSIQGFRIAAYCQNSDDEQVWGTERGIQYFYPDELYNYKTNLKLNINRIETRKIVTNLTQSNSFNLTASDNYVSFYFGTIEYLTQLRTFYEYKLEGLDAGWIKVVNQNFVRYSAIPPGKYIFKVRASNDGKIWKEAENEVTINVGKPFLQKAWVRLFGIVLGVSLIWFVINFYRKKQMEQQEELETQMVINYFASQINSYQNTDDILWNVVQNCISKLKFEECVIYQVDEERNVLVQKAAHGPKMAKDFTISQPIEIPVGKGIVGSVAMTGKPELIGNTELDTRYIVDDAKRYSELAVPVIADHKVIGVIDSEHSRKNFFTQKHLNILTTIALLCGNQIQRAKAEDEKQKAKIETLENKQKVTESRLQSLRLQMNPHFLFNALNSIQQMILANEELVATRFLSRFSKLLRTILIHSDKETVTLKEELEILNLYIELEARRFKDSFHYTIECDEEIDEDEIKIPTLLIQPFVENAIWHGLMHKEGDRKLRLRFFETDNFLHCVIEDNGIGRKGSEEAKRANGQNSGHISKGIQVSLERLKTIHNKNGNEGSLNITDLYDENGQAAGTRVEINFPVQN
jgi:ligand-binding sensor domain-containing protein/putative methionine-R-sulfoxide reductase with GAF domain/anti-sigma regulatory factor (Ser/Thr protein kinase)